jgi:5'-nucleotidase (lipoprotein e(P4) family)
MRPKRNYIYALVLVVCSSTATYFVSHSSAQPGTSNNDYQIAATLYMQKAGEYRALAYQAYNIAGWRLDEDLSGKHKHDIPKADRKKARAIMVDIDETVLDNSAYQGQGIIQHQGFDVKSWYAFGELRRSKAVPGAVDFLNYAASKGVKVFFVSNRDEPQKQATMDNLKNVGLKDIGPDNLLLRQLGPDGKPVTSSKEPRREMIRQKYRIIFFLGDNLDDHSAEYEKKPVAERFSLVDRDRELFGKKYILLPNAIYGTWENALYGYKNLSDAEKARTRLDLLERP